MARVLLGVTGGIAAYKAVELVRLATGAGHSVRVVQTQASLQFVGRATFQAVTGAPVLVDEFEPDPARGAFPGDPEPGHARDLAPGAGSAGRRALRGARLGQHAGEARGRGWRTTCSPARRSPPPRRWSLAPAMNDRMWEHPATRANLDDPSRARRASRAARHGPAGVAGGVGHGPPRRAGGHPRRRGGGPRARALRAALARRPARAGHGGRHPRAHRLRALRRQPLLGPDGPGPRGRGVPAGRRGHADRRQRLAAAPGRGPRGGGGERRRARGRRARASSRPRTSCSWPRPWPTSARARPRRPRS